MNGLRYLRVDTREFFILPVNKTNILEMYAHHYTQIEEFVQEIGSERSM